MDIFRLCAPDFAFLRDLLYSVVVLFVPLFLFSVVRRIKMIIIIRNSNLPSSKSSLESTRERHQLIVER